MNFSPKLLLISICFIASFAQPYKAFASYILPTGFVYLHNIDRSIDQKLGFATDDNCIGQRLHGYNGNQAICTLSLAKELKKVQWHLKNMNPNYSLRVLDAYRPRSAAEHIKRWTADLNDTKTKEKCYPDLDKSKLLGKYVANRSPHSRGSSVDVTIIDIRTKQELDFGPHSFGDSTHYNYAKLTKVQRENRLMLRNLMLKHKFKPYDNEFRQFTLLNEPFPNTYFNFPIRNERK